MLQQALSVRELRGSSDDTTTRYELYDSDTGTPLGTFPSQAAAQDEMARLKASNRAALAPAEGREDPGTG
ncbi:hypothetical protein [Modicisalibacter tunisiensis]|uniref:SPOR domain-containing protein n=1 Tax=Modicisalibacter tunisiensis TaxID=390637 RepID=A0ABS7X0V0_9GAMM|nr:hypothetical protein [Modicisalibacter tunisiensis]MBZ9568520.1 hypothetical protein [Modicisalibacter tunisiensis]